MSRKLQRERHPVANAVRILRLTLGQTQQEFAFRLKTTIRTIARYETSAPPIGKRLRQFENLARDNKLETLAELFRRNIPMRQIDPKFRIEGDQILNAAGRPIPEDEPLFLLRAKDRHALDTLEYYRTLCAQDHCTDYHLQGIEDRILAFDQFRLKHPERMKQPGSTRGL